jgi:hypothetical protein
VDLGGCIATLAVVGLALFALYDYGKGIGDKYHCYALGNQLNTAMRMYAADYDDRLPPAALWSDLIVPYHKQLDDLPCPSRPKTIGPRAFNLTFDRRLTREVPDNAPLLFESNAGHRNYADHLESFTRPHKGKGWIVLGGGACRSFVDPPDTRLGR